MKRTKYIIATLLALGVVQAKAEVIYSDNFGGTGTNSLNGTTPDITTGGETWAAGNTFDSFNADGTLNVAGGSNNANDNNATLAFTPEVGKVYTFSADIAMTSTGWLGLGFVGGDSGANDFATKTGAAPGQFWMLTRTADVMQAWKGPGATTALTLSSPPTISSGVTTSYVMTLDASDSDNVLLSINIAGGALELDEYNAGTLAGLGIAGVGFSADKGNAGGTIESFELSVVPEPATLGLVATFGGGILFLRRRLMM